MEKIELLVVGAGGTGTYFLKEVARYLAAKKEKSPVTQVVVMDGDTVELKNLSRQAFQEEDIGRNKAEAITEAINDVYGLSFMYIPEYLTKLDQLNAVFSNKYKTVPVIISCVDNHAARLLLEEYFDKHKNCILYDSGNEYETGEVVFANKVNGQVISPVRSVYFPDIKTGDLRSVEEMSCEELNNAAPQHIFTNMCAGLALLSAFSDLMDEKPVCGMTMFNPRALSMEFFPYQQKEA